MAKTINIPLLVALLLFLSAFFVTNVNFLSGFYIQSSIETRCSPGDVDHDGNTATELDVQAIDYLIQSFSYTTCGDINKDKRVNYMDHSILLTLKAREDASRQGRGRYCFNECSKEGEKVCTAQDYVTSAGAVIQKGNNLYKLCGNYDTDLCLEWSPDSFSCPNGSTCRLKNPGTDTCVLANLAEENVLVTQY